MKRLGLTGAAHDFAEQVSWSQTTFGWAQPWRKQKLCWQLGPLSILRELEEGVWCISTVLPFEASKTDVRVDVFGTNSTLVSSHVIQKWKTRLEKEVASLSSTQPGQLRPFIYECGGKRSQPFPLLELIMCRTNNRAFCYPRPAVSTRSILGYPYEPSFPIYRYS